MGLPQDLHESIEGLNAYIQNARRQIENGVIVELGSLEETVEMLCSAVAKMEGTSAQLLKPQMADLISSLDGLAVSLQDFMTLKQQEQNQKDE